MKDDPLFYLLMTAMAVVVLILMTGIGAFAKGGEFNRKNGNRLMRWRLIAQAVTIAIFLLYMWMRMK